VCLLIAASFICCPFRCQLSIFQTERQYPSQLQILVNALSFPPYQTSAILNKSVVFFDGLPNQHFSDIEVDNQGKGVYDGSDKWASHNSRVKADGFCSDRQDAAHQFCTDDGK